MAGYSLWGGKESDTTELLSLLTILVALKCVCWGRGSASLDPVRFQELRTDPRPLQALGKCTGSLLPSPPDILVSE